MESTGHSGSGACQRHFTLNYDYFPDGPHGGQRAVIDGLRKSGMYPFILAMLVTRNIPHGPWSEDIRFNQMQQSMTEHFEFTLSAECPLFQSLARSMLNDTGDLHLAGEEDTEDNLWNELAHVGPYKKAAKGNINRFMSTIRELRALDKNRHKLLYAYVHLAIELDFFSGNKGAGYVHWSRQHH